MYGFEIGGFETHEEQYQCGFLAGSTDLKKVMYVWNGKVIANIILDVDRGTTVVHARKKFTGDLHMIHPFFLKRYVRKCMKYEIKWIRGRNKLWDIFDEIHRPRLDAIIPKENKMFVLYPLVNKCFEDFESLETFLKEIAHMVAPNWTVDIKVNDNKDKQQSL
jgi:hypothetical protein